jgi:hypothetical protein
VRVPSKKHENPSREICELKPQSSEMLRWYGKRGKRSRGKEGGFGLMRKLWNMFPGTQFPSSCLEFIHNI